MADYIDEQDDCVSDEEIHDVEIVKSKIVSHSSCEFPGENQSPCSTRHLPCPAQIELAEVADNDKSPKTRKFKKIPLPHWLTKPHKRSSTHDHDGKSTRQLGNKKKMTRANSAPKALGANMRLNLKEHQHSTIAEGNEQTLTEVPEKLSIPSMLNPRRIDAVKRDLNNRESIWRRRASLPSNVGYHYNEIKKSPLFQRAPHSLTPKQVRKQFNPSEKLEKDVIKVLLFGVKSTSAHIKQTTLDTKLGAGNHDIRDEHRNEGGSYHSNNRNVPRLQLHSLDTPDMFFIPVIDEEGEENLTRKFSISAGNLCTATRIDPDEDVNEMIQNLIVDDLKRYLDGHEFVADVCQRWCSDLSQSIKAAVQNFKGEEHKVVCVVYIGALRGNGVHASVQCTLTPHQDNFATADYKNHSLYAFASVMVNRFE